MWPLIPSGLFTTIRAPLIVKRPNLWPLGRYNALGIAVAKSPWSFRLFNPLLRARPAKAEHEFVVLVLPEQQGQFVVLVKNLAVPAVALFHVAHIEAFLAASRAGDAGKAGEPSAQMADRVGRFVEVEPAVGANHLARGAELSFDAFQINIKGHVDFWFQTGAVQAMEGCPARGSAPVQLPCASWNDAIKPAPGARGGPKRMAQTASHLSAMSGLRTGASNLPAFPRRASRLRMRCLDAGII